MLLPLPATVARGISLENHLALATMRSGHATADTMVALLRVLYMAFLMLDRESTPEDLALFIEAETALEEGVRTAEQGGGWQLPEQRQAAIAHVVLRHDEAVAALPKYRYVEAWEKLNRFADSPRLSPLPGSKVGKVWR